jgi:uncharacterized protein (TIGR03435 family)
MKPLLAVALIALASGSMPLRGDMSFETASIKATPDHMPPRNPMQVDSRRVTLNGWSLKMLIQMAYQAPEWKLDSVTGWMDSRRYDIAAIFPEGAGQKQLPEMLRALLVERFALRTATKSRSMKVYALTSAKTGAKLQPSTEGTTWDGNGGMNGGIFKGRLLIRDMTMGGLAAFLATKIGKPVLDQTKLTGKYAIDLKWSPTEMDAAGTSTEGPSIFTALEEQLGLTLRTTTATIKVLSILHANPPSGN